MNILNIEDAKWTLHVGYAPDGTIPVFMQIKDETGNSMFPRVVSVKSWGPPLNEIAIAERVVAALNYCRGKNIAELVS